jgi:hypothetical protein
VRGPESALMVPGKSVAVNVLSIMAPGVKTIVEAPGPNRELNVHPQIGPGEAAEMVSEHLAKQSANTFAGAHACLAGVAILPPDGHSPLAGPPKGVVNGFVPCGDLTWPYFIDALAKTQEGPFL